LEWVVQGVRGVYPAWGERAGYFNARI
jgi:hypothetical protein